MPEFTDVIQPPNQNQTVRFQSHPREALTSSPASRCCTPQNPNNDSRNASTPAINTNNSHRKGYNRNKALFFSYQTQYQAAYGDSGIPYTRPMPPRFHECAPDQVSWRSRTYGPPLRVIEANDRTHGQDADTGCYEWRQLMPRPGDLLWQSMERNLFWKNVGKRMPLPPARVIAHNPLHEKQRWDKIKRLDAANCLSYGYRRHTPGYAGHVNITEHVDTSLSQKAIEENKAMESTVQASYREHPAEMYQHHNGGSEAANKHKGPLSRMVTLTHPFNPFTQQSAYHNMGATDTTSNSCSCD